MIERGLTKQSLKILAGAAAMFFCGASAFATNGYFVNGFDPTQQAAAGAGLTEGDGPVSSAANPAVGIKMGNIAGGSASAFMPDRTATVGGAGPLTPGTYHSDNNLFFIPNGGINMLVDSKTSLGLTLVANGGMETRYEGNPFAGLGAGSTPLGVGLQQAFLSLNAARKLTDTLSVGAAPVLAVQSFQAYGLEAFKGSSSNPGAVTGNGNDWSVGCGARFGAVWDANRYVSVAAAYQTRMWMSRLSQYSGLFAGSGDFDVPPEVSVGLTLRPTSAVAVMLDWQRIFYSQVAAVGNTELVSPAANPLGASGGAGFGWQNMDVYHLGVKWAATDAWTLRAGYSHATQAFNPSEAEFNILAPGVITDHVSAGASYKLTRHWTVDAAYTHAFRNTVNGTANPYFGSTQPISLALSEENITLGASYRW
ncbi:MAG: hypothetical protein HKL90_10695 [Elusimicrobia bacterium]|nr:hypothetical protein [Elusimicrobiota bacterium]